MNARLVDGQLQYAPKKYITPTTIILGFSDNQERMIREGYYPLEYDTQPEVPEGKMLQPSYTLVEPVATVTMVDTTDEEGNVIQVEQTTYDRPNPIIRVSYTLVDAPVEEALE